MAIRKEDQNWIQKQIDKAIADVVDSLRPHGWRRAIFLLRELGPLVATVAVFVAMMGITLGALYQAFGHVKEETEFRTHTKDTLDQIQATLRELQAPQSPKKVLQEISTLDANQFAKNLPALHKVIDQPVNAVAPTAAVLRNVAERLQGLDESSPGYWPTVLKFIQFASAGLSPDVPPPGPPNLIIRGNAGFGRMLSDQSHAIVLLDGGDLGQTRFDHSRIIFTEHPVRMRDVVFTDCVFEMPISATPSPYIQKASQSLLASGFTSATFAGLN